MDSGKWIVDSAVPCDGLGREIEDARKNVAPEGLRELLLVLHHVREAPLQNPKFRIQVFGFRVWSSQYGCRDRPLFRKDHGRLVLVLDNMR